MVKRINLLNFLSYRATEGVTANVKGKMSTRQTPNGVFLHVDSLLLDLNIKKPRLSVAKIFNNNRILSEWKSFPVESFHQFNTVKNLQPKPQISSWKRTDMRFWKPCSLNCRKSSVLNSQAFPMPCWTMFHETISWRNKLLVFLLGLFSKTFFSSD